MDACNVYSIILYILGIVLLIVLIFLGIKMILTLNKVDKVIDDISEKSKKLDLAFSVMDKITDSFSSINDKLIELTVNAIKSIFNKRKKNKERTEDNE